MFLEKCAPWVRGLICIGGPHFTTLTLALKYENVPKRVFAVISDEPKTSNHDIRRYTHKLPPGETSPITTIVPTIGVQTVSSPAPLPASITTCRSNGNSATTVL